MAKINDKIKLKTNAKGRHKLRYGLELTNQSVNDIIQVGDSTDFDPVFRDT